jgi:copper chaperone CopZ
MIEAIKMKEVILKVEGMHCGECEAKVNDLVRKAINVKSVKSNRKQNQTTIVLEDDVDYEPALKAVNEFGYKAEFVSEGPYEKKGFFARFRK